MTPGPLDHHERRARMTDALLIDPTRAVALTIDMQRAYLDVEIGDKALPAERAEAILSASSRLLGACRELGVPVVHVYVNREPLELQARLGSSRFASISRELTDGRASERPDRPTGSAQAELHPALAGPGDVHIRSKKTSDSYHGTELAVLFEQVIKPETVIVMGINTETCVHAGVFGTKVRGYKPVVASDCVGTHRDPETSAMALELMSRTIAWVLRSDEIATKLGDSTIRSTGGVHRSLGSDPASSEKAPAP